MRAEPEQTTAEPVGPPEVRPETLKKPRAGSVPVARPADAPVETVSSPSTTEPISLLPQDAAGEFRARWETIQSGFVDDPHQAVEQASALVEEALQQLTAVFENKRKQFQRGGEIATEDLRQTLRHYRLLLNRLF